MATLAKDLKTLMKAAEKQGWRIEKGRKHIKWFAPDGVTIIVSGNTESGRAANHLARLKGTGQFTI